ncbi:hypothetical protein ABT127_20200 [Streptomyces sp. NPDC001904]|uniref:hypothetical protein n=1 Tax=Streptomyces sp. NPDC001904 TaxID=3154531 RepID=UPI00331C450D
MNTAMNYLTVLFVLLLLAGPSLYGIARDRRIDREIRAAREARETEERRSRYTAAA